MNLTEFVAEEEERGLALYRDAFMRSGAYIMALKMCDACGGTGQLKVKRVRARRLQATMTECLVCGGSGSSVQTEGE